MVAVYPSLISGNLLNLESTIRMLDPLVAGYHLDIMDAHFVPNLTWGPAFIEAIAEITNRPLWVHLMVTNPLWWIDMLRLPKNSTASFHIESCKKIETCIIRIREKKWRPSIAISPKTNLGAIFSYTSLVDHILLMSVEPGRSGQQFLPDTITRLQVLKKHREEKKESFIIGIDGGINYSNIKKLVDNGAEQLAVAAGIFHAGMTPDKAVQRLYDQCQ